MAAPKFKKFYKLSFITLMLLSNSQMGCFWEAKKKSSQKSANQSPELVIRDSIFFDRLGDRTSARISFKTKVKVLCEISFGPQDSLDSGNRNSPRPCSSTQDSQLSMSDVITGLDPNKFYYVYLLAKNSENQSEVDSITIREPGSPASPNEPSTQANNSPPGPFQPPGSTSTSDLFIGRIDLVLKSGEVFRHTMKPNLDSEQVRLQLKQNTGCFDQAPSKTHSFGIADANPIITQLATRDLGSATANTRQELPGILQLDYSSINEGVDKWTFMYRYQNKDQIFTSRPVIRFSKVLLLSEPPKDLDYPNLDDTSDPVKIDSRKDLQIQWSVPPQTPATSYVHVQIGRPTLQKSIYCVFQADQRRGIINSRFFSNLQQGSHVISVGLSTILFSPKERWITTTYDWRSGRIEK